MKALIKPGENIIVCFEGAIVGQFSTEVMSSIVSVGFCRLVVPELDSCNGLASVDCKDSSSEDGLYSYSYLDRDKTPIFMEVRLKRVNDVDYLSVCQFAT